MQCKGAIDVIFLLDFVQLELGPDQVAGELAHLPLMPSLAVPQLALHSGKLLIRRLQNHTQVLDLTPQNWPCG